MFPLILSVAVKMTLKLPQKYVYKYIIFFTQTHKEKMREA